MIGGEGMDALGVGLSGFIADKFSVIMVSLEHFLAITLHHALQQVNGH